MFPGHWTDSTQGSPSAAEVAQAPAVRVPLRQAPTP
ncbi:MAG: hypothetical protein ACI9OJ_003099 [Myxococcota bacterium]|jgi:hypothetical protein